MLGSSGHAEHTDSLLDSGFSSVHAFVPSCHECAIPAEEARPGPSSSRPS